MNCDPEFYEDVRNAAYDLYVRRGLEHNRDLEDLLIGDTALSEA